MLFVVIGALLGLLFGGPVGIIVGALIGYVAGKLLKRSALGGLRVMQSELIDTTFSVMGAVCKADDVITRDEIDLVERVFKMVRLQPEQREQAKAAFNRGKQPDFDLDAAVDRFAKISHRRAPLLQLFLQLQCMAITADGTVHPTEHAILVRIAQRLGLRERDVAQLEALLRATAGGPSAPGAPPGRGRLADAYAALGISPGASETEIKRAYRKLISENHPDKLAARGLPESMRAVAEERSRELNAAYDLIKSERGIV